MSWLLGAATVPAAGGQVDPVAHVALALFVILIAAKIGGEIAVRLGQPAVLGELLIGVMLGNFTLLGVNGLEPIATDPTIDMLARIGVLILLFEVGVESTVGQMMRVGVPSLLVAVLGVVAPFALGWGVGAWLVPEQGPYVHAFLGATLCATSIGITARVLQDLGVSKTQEARVILGAAVIDDVLGLVILAVVSGIIAAADAGGSMSYTAVSTIVAKAMVFLVGAIAIGVLVTPKLFGAASRLRAKGVLLSLGLAFCFLMAWAAHSIGLAPMVGAFAAGLILEDLHSRQYVQRGEHDLHHQLGPISSFLVPVFFVLMGMQTDLLAFLEPGVMGLAAALTIAAIIGKMACSLALVRRKIDALSIGLGMVPRGEVGLIFANAGATLMYGGHAVLSPSTFSAVVVMVIGTTMVTPPALKWSVGRATVRAAPEA